MAATLTVTGTHVGSYLGFPASDRAVRWTTTEFLTVEDGLISRRSTTADRLSLVQQLAAPRPGPAPVRRLPTRTVADLPVEQGMESIAVDADGNLYVTFFLSSQVGRITPAGDISIYATLPGLGNIAFGPDGALYTTTTGFGDAQKAVWRLDPAGSHQRIAVFPAESLPNGITFAPDGVLYVADSVLGTVWRVPPGGGEPVKWVTSDLLAPRAGIGNVPGADGVKIYRGHLYVSVFDAETFVRIPIRGDGTAGIPEVYATDLPSDDFAFDVRGNLYATTHDSETVVRLSANGNREVIATAEDGLTGPTSVAFGTRRDDRSILYTVSDGGWFSDLIAAYRQDPHYTSPGRATVIATDTGIRGLPLPSR